MKDRFVVLGEGYTMLVKVTDRGGDIVSTLKDGDTGASEVDRALEDAQIDVVESLVLAHACAGIDVEDLRYVEGLNTTVNAILR